MGGKILGYNDDELEFDDMVNDDSEDDGIPGIPSNDIYTPLPHMTNFNVGGDEPHLIYFSIRICSRMKT